MYPRNLVLRLANLCCGTEMSVGSTALRPASWRSGKERRGTQCTRKDGELCGSIVAQKGFCRSVETKVQIGDDGATAGTSNQPMFGWSSGKLVVVRGYYIGGRKLPNQVL